MEILSPALDKPHTQKLPSVAIQTPTQIMRADFCWLATQTWDTTYMRTVDRKVAKTKNSHPQQLCPSFQLVPGEFSAIKVQKMRSDIFLRVLQPLGIPHVSIIYECQRFDSEFLYNQPWPFLFSHNFSFSKSPKNGVAGKGSSILEKQNTQGSTNRATAVR